MICAKCGSNVADGFKFCPNCGQNIQIIQEAKAPLIEKMSVKSGETPNLILINGGTFTMGTNEFHRKITITPFADRSRMGICSPWRKEYERCSFCRRRQS